METTGNLETTSETPQEYQYKQYLSDREATGVKSGGLKKDVDMGNNKISLLTDRGERVFNRGISTHSYSTLYYTDIQEYGYEKFEAYVGIAASARGKSQENANYAKVEFKVYADGKEVFASGEMTSETTAKHVEVDLKEVSVLQLVVESLGPTSYDHASWGDAAFYKEIQSPYLSVDDLEFNLPEQVTSANVLEYAKAKSMSNEDLTNLITYETNYTPGKTGEFQVTYSVKDKENHIRKRTVNLVVTGEAYHNRLPMERLKKPWANYLYHGRGTLSTQGKKAWDLALKEVLDFKPKKWKQVSRWGAECYVIDIDLQENGIYVAKSELTRLQTMFVDDEPRCFILPDWANEVTEENGLASHIKLFVRKNTADEQEKWLEKIETNAVQMVSEVKPDMNEAQRVYFALKKYASWIKYGNGGQLLHEALGNGVAVCGGNARGTVYLTQKVGVKSIFARSNVHAWSYSKLYDRKEWYKNDLLAGPAILVNAFASKHNLNAGGDWAGRHNYLFEFINEDYPKNKLHYPSVG